MLTLSNLFSAQRRFGTSSDVSETEHVTYEFYLAGCRRFSADKTPPDYHNWSMQRQKEYTDSIIIQFVQNNAKDVEGFADENGDMDIEALINRLRSDITDFGILKHALEDDEVQEIWINDFKTLFVVKHGITYPYVDERGKPYQFVSDEELQSTINRLIYNPHGNSPRMTIKNPLLNARATYKGYRVSAVNNSAIARDLKDGFDFPVTSVSIRKFTSNYLTFEDYVRYETMDEKMADFIRLCCRAFIRLICVGATSSGKTTLLWTMVNELPKEMRKILIQNPTEIMAYNRSSETGVNLNNVVHWDATDLSGADADDPTTPTMANFAAHALRNSPDIIIQGESRTPKEMHEFIRAGLTGHRAMTSLHADDAEAAVSRIATELSSLGGNYVDHKRSVASVLDIVISQARLPDGSRHVMSIDEVTGSIDEEGKAKTRTLFTYVLDGDGEKDTEDRITKINGHFEQINSISDRLKRKFQMAGIFNEELAPFLKVDNTTVYKSAYLHMDDENTQHISEIEEMPEDINFDFFGGLDEGENSDLSTMISNSLNNSDIATKNS